MLGHAGGAASLDAPAWLLADGAAACVLLATVLLRPWASTPPATSVPAGPAVWTGPVAALGAVWRGVGRVLGPALLAVTIAAAFAGPDSEVVNLAPSAVLVVWWIGLPLVCVAAGDVMAWLNPFGPAAGLGGRRRARERTGRPGVGPTWTAAALLAAVAWWVHAYHGADSPRTLGAALVAYTALAAAGAWRWGPGWLRRGEAFGALSAGLAALRRPRAVTCPAPPPGLVAVWLGSVAFDVFSGSGAWVDLAGASSGWSRTAIATGALGVAVAAAGALVAGTAALAGRATGARAGTGTHRTAAAGAEGDTPAADTQAGRATGAQAATGTHATAGTGAEGDTPAGDTQAGGATGATGVGQAMPGTGRAMRGAGAEAQQREARGAAHVALLAATAGAFLAHGVTLLLVDGQRALAHASDPFDRGWDLLGTRDLLTDYTPLTPTAVGIVQLVLAVGAGLGAVAAAAGRLRAAAGDDRLTAPAAGRVLWTIGLVVAALATMTVAVLATELE